MTHFITAHAGHPDWAAALSMATRALESQSAQLDSMAAPFSLGWCYFSDHYAAHSEALWAALKQNWPQVRWVGCAAVGVLAGGVEYVDEPALVLMLAALPPGRFEIFSGAQPLQRIEPYTALVHADPATPDLPELIAELSDRTETGYLFGGLVSSRAGGLQLAGSAGVLRGGLSGVAFSADVALVSRVTQGCQPIGRERLVTAAERNLVLELDGQPALPALLQDLGVTLEQPREALERLRATLVGMSSGDAALLGRGGQFGADTRVRHLIGLDPGRNAVAVADLVEPGMRLAFCQRNVDAARRDLVRICSEIRDALQPADDDAAGRARPALGAIYVSCTGRGGSHFGAPSAEMQIIQRALGEVPLVGFFAAGEIARHHLYGYTGVLTVFTGAAPLRH